jgi:hypothetical protein
MSKTNCNGLKNIRPKCVLAPPNNNTTVLLIQILYYSTKMVFKNTKLYFRVIDNTKVYFIVLVPGPNAKYGKFWKNSKIFHKIFAFSHENMIPEKRGTSKNIFSCRYIPVLKVQKITSN